MSPREHRNRRKGKRGGGRGVRNGNSSRDGLVKNPSKEESVKLVEEQEGTHQLEPEFLTCARPTPSNAVKEAKEQNAEGVHPIKGVFNENVLAPVVNSDNGRRKSTTEEEAIAPKAKSSQEAETASPCLTSHIPPDNHKRCSADGPKNHSPGEEDIYRDEEEIEKEGGKKDPEGSNKVGLAPEMDIMEYCHKEWRGQTAVTNLMKKGYKAVSQDFTSIRRVRGDNYCALRALLFQAMSQTTELPPWLQNPDLIEMPAKLMRTYDWIKQWKLRYSCDEEQINPHLEQIRENLELLKEKWQTLSEIDIPADKQAACDEVFQNEHEAYCLYEAVKFLMLSKAIDLYNDSLEGKEVPMFSWLLFARNTSSNPQEFMENHLNQVGYTGGLEQVEMFLLGYTVQHTIKVYRLYKHDTDEFITLYPNDQEDWPVVALITEDDRHYNVPVGIQTQELET